jgi:hypothetical protein
MNKCNICSDGPCDRDICKRKPYKILGCIKCPAYQICGEIENNDYCIITKNNIEGLVNGKDTMI